MFSQMLILVSLAKFLNLSHLYEGVLQFSKIDDLLSVWSCFFQFFCVEVSGAREKVYPCG